MSARHRQALQVAVLLPLLGGSAIAAPTVKETKRSLERLEAQQQATGRELKATEQRRDALQGQLRAVELEIAAASRDLRETNARLRDTEQRLADLNRRGHGQEQALATERAGLAAQLNAQYALGKPDTLKILLGSENPNTKRRLLTYYHHLHENRLAKLASIDRTAVDLQQTRTDLASQQEELRRLLAQQATQVARLEQRSSEQQSLIQKLSTEIASRQSRLAELTGDEKRLRDTLQQLQRQLARAKSEPGQGGGRGFATLKGRLPKPVDAPLAGRSRSGGGTRSATGLLFGARAGQEVRAIATGRVVFADWMRGYGLLLIIDHGTGYLSLYGQNESLLKGVGDAVNQGDNVAVVGNSGGAAQPGLYFELRKDGKPIDPNPWWARGR